MQRSADNQSGGPSPEPSHLNPLKVQNSFLSAGSSGAPSHIQMPKLTAAQIENRRYSIYIKNLSVQ